MQLNMSRFLCTSKLMQRTFCNLIFAVGILLIIVSLHGKNTENLRGTSTYGDISPIREILQSYQFQNRLMKNLLTNWILLSVPLLIQIKK